MIAYRYAAARRDGGVVRGVVHAESARSAESALATRGLAPLALAPATEEPAAGPAVDRRALAIAFRSLAALVRAGVPVERALATSADVSRPALQAVLTRAGAALREGQSLAQALAGSGGAIPPVVLGMIRAGERGSRLGEALDQVAAHLEQEADLAARLRQALAYPLLLAGAGTVSLLVIGTVILPRFAALLGDLGGQLPLTTRLLLGGSQLVSHAWGAGLAILGAGTWGASWLLRRPAVRAHVDTWLLALPAVGAVRLALATARFGRALGAMLATGLPLLPALDAAREAAGDPAIAARLARARDLVAAGRPLATALERERALTPVALELVAVGEASGRLAEMTQRAGDLAAADAARGLHTLVTLLEPALIIGFGGVVAFVAAALLQAVYAVRPW